MTNVALVVLDTLRKDRFDRHFDWLPGTTFDHAWSTSHWTVPAHASLFTGLYASETGVYGRSPSFDCDEPTLAEELDDAGYRTRGFSCNPFISDTFGFIRGFDEMKRNWSSRRLDDDVFDWGDFQSEKRFDGVLRFPEALYRVLATDVDALASLKHGLRRKLYHDGSVFADGDKGARAVLRHLRRTRFGDGEFFFVNLMEAHGPYRCPEEFQTTTETHDGEAFADVLSFETARPESTRQAYDDCVRYLADVYRDIFEELRASFDYVLTVADHGELLGELGCWGHDFGVHPALTNVPFDVYAADGAHAALDADATVSLLDVHATVLGRMGVESDGRGVDLFRDRPEGARLAEYHGINNPETYEQVRETEGEAVADEYDEWRRGVALPPTYYGWESVEGFEERGTADAASPREALASLVDDLDVREANGDRELSESVREELEYLGYL